MGHRQHREGFHHGALAVDVRRRGLPQPPPVRVIVTHLSPHSAARRRAECARLAALATDAQEEGLEMLLLGDLNTLSPLDQPTHTPGLLGVLRSDPRLRRKFLDDRGQAPDFGPMNELLSVLVDLGAPTGGPGTPLPDVPGAAPRHTVPTVVCADAMHAAPLRLDFVMATPALAARYHHRAHPVDTPDTQQLSDHFPVLLDAGPPLTEVRQGQRGSPERAEL